MPRVRGEVGSHDDALVSGDGPADLGRPAGPVARRLDQLAVSAFDVPRRAPQRSSTCARTTFSYATASSECPN
jgi:hypothetical protein